MKSEDTYNIHKIINCVFPRFKSKMLCRLEKHNYIIKDKENRIYKAIYTSEFTGAEEVKYFQKERGLSLICRCCGKTIELEE